MGHLDPKQPPTKRKPFASLLNHWFIHKVDLIIPAELLEIISKDVLNQRPAPAYSRVILPLSALLEGRFFNEYIKKGNVLMLSQGVVGVENVYVLRDGRLTLHLDKESYERAGIVGEPEGLKGKRGTKPRWNGEVVTIDLRAPSMLHGKKGFDRIVYAFKNVLKAPVTWLFHNSGIEVKPDPLEIHVPARKHVSPETSEIVKVKMPNLIPPKKSDTQDGESFENFAIESLEWLSMVLLESPRIHPADNIDPYLSRYQPPGECSEGDVVKITWQGFIASSWAHQNFVDILLSVSRDGWFAYSVTGFAEEWTRGVNSSMILKVPGDSAEFMLWDVV